MADEEYRSEIIISINDSDAAARAPEVEARFNKMIDRINRRAKILGQQRIQPIIDVRDRLTGRVLAADRLVKRLSGEVAAPVLTAQDRVTGVLTKMNEMIEAAAQGKHEVALGLRTEALAQIEKAEKAARIVSQMKGSPYMELGGPILQQLETAKERLTKLDLTKVEPLAALRDKLSSGLEKNKVKLKELSLAHASPVIAVQDRMSAVATRLSAMIEAINAGKIEVAAKMKGPLMEEIARAREAAGALGNIKTGPIADLRGDVFSDLGRLEGIVRDVDGMLVQPKATLIDRATPIAMGLGRYLHNLTSSTWTVIIQAKDFVTGTVRRIWRTLTSPLGLLGMGVGGAAVVAGVIKAPLQLAGSMEQAKIGFETMLGSAEKAGKFLRDLQRFAALTPFEFPELQDASKRLLAFGFQAEEILPTMTAIGNAASGLGIGAEGINRLILAIGQMRAKAKVSGEEMRQLTEAGIPAWDMLAKAMGKSTAQIMKMSEKGLIPAGKAIDILIKGMNERFPGMMEKQSRSLFGLWSTIKDTFNMSILYRWGDGLSKAIKPRLEKLVDLFTKNEDVVNRWGDTLERIAQRAGDRVMGFLERAFNRVDQILRDPKFQKADLFGQTQILWDEIIAKPFDRWWNAGGREWIIDVGMKVGSALVKGIVDVASSNPLVGALLGGYIGGLPGAAAGFGWGASGWLRDRALRSAPQVPGVFQAATGAAAKGPITLAELEYMSRSRLQTAQGPSMKRLTLGDPVTDAMAREGLLHPAQAERLGSVPDRTPRIVRLTNKGPVVEKGAWQSTVPGYARGGIVTKPRVARIAEDGPEAVIPLKPHMRERSLTLVRETERILGVDEPPEVQPIPVAGPTMNKTTIVHIHMGDAVKSIEVHSRVEADRVAEEAANIVGRRLKEILGNIAS